jgi:hypothetical protein
MSYSNTCARWLGAIAALAAFNMTPLLSRADAPTCPERANGAGRLTTQAGTVANFGFMAFFDPTAQTYRGSFHYTDRSIGIAVTATGLTSYDVVSPDTRFLSYSLDPSTGYDEARVILTDAGNSGADDTVVVQLLLNGSPDARHGKAKGHSLF